MNLAETHRLLTAISSVDNRKFDDATVTAWRHILAEHQPDDCLQAALDHFREQPDAYLMPGHIHRRAIDIARRRAGQARREQLEAQQELEAAETIDRTEDVIAMVNALAARMGSGDPNVLRRPEWVEWERRRQRELTAVPNPRYNPRKAAEMLRRNAEDGVA